MEAFSLSSFYSLFIVLASLGNAFALSSKSFFEIARTVSTFSTSIIYPSIPVSVSNALITPSRQISTSSDPDIETIQTRRLATIISEITGANNISAWLSTQNMDPTSIDLGKWPDIDYTTGCAAQRANWPAEVHWNRLLTMAGAWFGGVEGAEQYTQDSDVRTAISNGMDWWFIRDFTNPSCLDSGGTPACPCNVNETQLWNTNWFSNIIGIPELVSATCLLMNNTLSTSQLNNCTHMTSRSYATFGTVINGLGELTGANTLDVAKIGLDLALLTVNESLISDAYGRVHNELQIHPAVKADGIRPDGSFGQHDGLLYNGNYGKDYTNDLLDLEHEASETQFAANETSMTAFSVLFDGSRWMIYYNTLTGVLHWDFSVLGRFISFPVIDNQATASIKINLTKVDQLGQEWNADALSTFADTLSHPVTNANAGRLTGNRAFYANDYMVHRGANYVATLKMFSTRTSNTECVNNQNPFGFHASDGTLYTYIRGDEYEDIAAVFDWNSFPGITVDYGATPLNCSDAGFSGIENFVGGVSDGRVGVAAMRYTNPFTQSLRFQKTWFFLDDDVQHVMVAGIESTTTAPIHSVLDQRRHSGPVIVNDFELDTKITGYNFSSNLESLWHGDIGYIFDTTNDITLSIQVGQKTGNWSAIGISTQPPAVVDMFTASLVHGSLNGSVTYTAFPGLDRESFATKKQTFRIRSVRNDSHVSAIWDIIHQTAMAVFWDIGGGVVEFPSSTTDPAIGFFSISSDGNIALLFHSDTGNVTVSDPSQELESVVVTFTFGGGKEQTVKRLVFSLPQGGIAGSSVTQNMNMYMYM